MKALGWLLEGGPGSGKRGHHTDRKKPSGKGGKSGGSKLSADMARAALDHIEKSGAGFYNRNSDGTMSIFVRGSSGNDPAQWANANAIADHFGGLVRSVAPDPQSGHVVVTIKDPFKQKESMRESAPSYLSWLYPEDKKKETSSASASPANLRANRESSKTKDLSQIHFMGSFREASDLNITVTPGTTEAPGRRFRTVLLQEGMGNLEDCYYYTREAIESCPPLFEGKKYFIDHPDAMEEKTRPERSVRDIAGWFENLQVEDAPDGRALLVGDTVLLESPDVESIRALMLESIAYSQSHAGKDLVGLSINAGGDFDTIALEQFIRTENIPEGCQAKLAEATQKGISMIRPVRKMTSATSCDLVTEAGAGGRISQLLERKRGTMAKKVDSKIKESEKKEAETKEAKEDGSAGTPGKDGSADKKGGGSEDHPDAEKDKELIMSMLQKHCGDGFTEEDHAMAREAYQNALEAHGGDEKEAMETAGRTMKMAKHMQSKQPKPEPAGPQSDAPTQESEIGFAPHKTADDPKAGLTPHNQQVEAAKVTESAKPDLSSQVVKLTGENAALKAKIEEIELGQFIDTKLKESKLPSSATKKFRECIKGLKTQKEVTEKLSVFQEGWMGGSGESGDGGFFINPEKGAGASAAGKMSFADCKET